MIEFLRGTLISKEEDHVVVEVGGVGYGLDVPRSTFERLPEIDEEVRLLVSMVVREDAMELYGFATPEEKRVFRIFLGVSGFGARLALDVLSTITIAELVSAIRLGNVAALTRIPGIGRKRAERLILELKDRVKDFPASSSHAAAATSPAPSAPPEGLEPDLFQDAVAAMESLGFKPAVASRCVASAMRAASDDDLAVEDLVKMALQMTR
ncbi:Holliday junction branch migration protein RuvA [Candidatus Sumerlaeota bacterium]|nr:Holliday junction branch migration protein RuvA [Candidatus Sumerlaeota bacterium]